ncbi:NAD-dependent epimerase/dehydratase family protein [Lentzea albidocapillata]|uniref:NAD-dependent epimerase/dehydratase family protein n=1 Tax=Lentzea albidocapillata TaxID=40571 RepID=UPI001FE33B93|nr:NAD(P)-dependent oxidoreductase [Lentzea albidocapillata]
MKILVTGGTGTLGRHVVPLLREAGADVVVLSRHGDIACDLLGDVPPIEADVVVHLAGGTSWCTSPVGRRATTSRPATCSRPAGASGTSCTSR